MWKILILFVLISISLSAQQSATKQNTSKSRKVEQQGSTNTVITLQRDECYGTCPVYKVEIFGDGNLIYHGINYVKTKGKVTSNVSSEQIQSLISEFEKAKYFSLRNSYVDGKDGCRGVVSDFSSVYISIQINKRKKSIKHYLGCHALTNNKFSLDLQKLKRLEEKIDEIIKIDQWIGTKEERDKFIYNERIN